MEHVETHMWMLADIECHQNDEIETLEKNDMCLYYAHHLDLTSGNGEDHIAQAWWVCVQVTKGGAFRLESDPKQVEPVQTPCSKYLEP